MAKLTPIKSTIILVVFLTLILIANGGLFYFANSFLESKSEEINTLAKEVKSSESEVQRLTKIKSQLEEIDDVDELLNKLVTIKDQNKYQETVIKIIENYAKKSGLEVSQINFRSAKISKSKTTISTNVSFVSPAKYDNLLKFVKLTENSLLRMQIINMSIAQAINKENPEDTSYINIGEIDLNVYIK